MATNPNTVPTQLVHTTGPKATPVEYDVPGSQEIQLSSVAATFDGSGAGGDFDATLSIYSQDGQLLSRTKAGPTVTAGDDGVATWIPFLRPKQTTPTPGATIHSIQLYDDNAAQTVASGNDLAVHFNHVSSFDSTVFGTTVVAGNVTRVTLKKPGVYSVFGWLLWDNTVTWQTWLYNIAPFGPTITPQMQSSAADAGALNGTFPMISYTREYPASLAGDAGVTVQQFFAGQDSGMNQLIDFIYWQFIYFGTTDF